MRFAQLVEFSDSRYAVIVDRVRQQTRVSALLYVFLAIFANPTAAHGLGELRVSSYLGDPLLARIAIIPGSTGLADRSLAVRVLAADEAQSLGVDILYVPYQFEAAIRYGSNSAEINITTRQAVKEPFMSFMVELRSAFGTQYREYPVILDPAFIAENNPLNLDNGNANPEEVFSGTISPFSTRSTRVESGKGLSDRSGSVIGVSDESIRVQRGQTLNGLASALSHQTDLSPNEIRDLLFSRNPHAFIAGDMNRLRAGVRLTVPKSINPAVQPEQVAMQEAAKQTGRVSLGTADKRDAFRESINSRARENWTLEQMKADIDYGNDAYVANDAYVEKLETLVRTQQEQITRLMRHVDSVSSEAQSGSPVSPGPTFEPENVGLQIIGSQLVQNGEPDEETALSRHVVSFASMVPEFRDDRDLSSYRVVWVAGVGILILLGGMFLYRCKQYPQRSSGMTSGYPGVALPVTNAPSDVHYCQVGGNVGSGDAQSGPQITCMTSGKPAEEGTLPSIENLEFFDVCERALEGFTQDIAVALKGRSDDEVRDSIAEKVSLYPGYDQCQNELIFEVEDWDYPRDDLDSAIEQAHLFCEFKQFRSAREVLEPLTGIDDVRLYEAIAKIEIQEIENRKLNRS